MFLVNLNVFFLFLYFLKMKNFVKQGLLVGVFAFFGLLMLTPSAEAKRWCCSWHWWVNYCASNGRYVCNDGTYSPTCTCGWTTSYTYTPKRTTYTPSYTSQNYSFNNYSSAKSNAQEKAQSYFKKAYDAVDRMDFDDALSNIDLAINAIGNYDSDMLSTLNSYKNDVEKVKDTYFKAQLAEVFDLWYQAFKNWDYEKSVQYFEKYINTPWASYKLWSDYEAAKSNLKVAKINLFRKKVRETCNWESTSTLLECENLLVQNINDPYINSEPQEIAMLKDLLKSTRDLINFKNNVSTNKNVEKLDVGDEQQNVSIEKCKDPTVILSCSLWNCPEICKRAEVDEAKRYLWNKINTIESIAKEIKLKDVATQEKIKAILENFHSSSDEYTRSVWVYLEYLLK